MEPGTVEARALRKRSARASSIGVATPSKKQRVTTSKNTPPVHDSPHSKPKSAAKHRAKRVLQPQNLWSVGDILCEETRGKDLWVLIVWSGTDPATGRPWDHNYEPVKNVGHELRHGWSLKKAAIANAKGAKDRELAARRTIHSYLADAGSKTPEYEIQSKSGKLNKSLLAQESPVYQPASFPWPEVRRYRSRTVESSPEPESSSPNPSKSCEIDTESPFDASGDTLQPPTKRVLRESGSPNESPTRNQTLHIRLPPPLSQPEAYDLVTASQLQRSPSSGTQEESSEDDLALATEASSVDERPVIPDSQSALQDSLKTESNSNGSLQLAHSTGRNTQSSGPTKDFESLAAFSASKLLDNSQAISDSVFNPSASHSLSTDPRLGRERDHPAELHKNSLGFTHSGRSASHSTSQGTNFALERASHSAAEEENSTRRSAIGEFESQIPYVPSQRILSTEAAILSAGFGRESIGSSAINLLYISDKERESQLESGESYKSLRGDAETAQFEERTSAASISLGLPDGGDSVFQVDSYSSLARAPSHSPAAPAKGNLPPRPKTPSLETNVSFVNMASEKQDNAVQGPERSRRRIWESPPTGSSNPSVSELSGPLQSSTESSTKVEPVVSATGPNPVELPGVSSKISRPDLQHDEQNLFLSLPLEGSARELYRSIFTAHQDILDALAQGSVTAPDVASELATTITQLFDTCAHMDLVDTDEWPNTQMPVSEATQVDWTAAVSSKCSFLKGFLQTSCVAEKHVVVYAKRGRFLGILEQFLRGIDINFSRPGKQLQSQDSQGSLRVTLMETSSNAKIDHADLVIGLDETFDPQSDQVVRVRQHVERGRLCPSVCLVVHHSIEHIWRSFGEVRDEDPLIKEKLALSAKKYRDQAGEPQPEELAPDEFGAKVAALFLSSEPPTTWRLPSVFDFQLDLLHEENVGATDAKVSVTANEATSSVTRDFVSNEARKRPLDVTLSASDASVPAKRARQTPNEPGSELESAEMAQNDSTTQEDSAVTEIVAETSAIASGNDGPVVESAVLLAKTEELLRGDVRAKERLLRELEVELGQLQTRFEDQTKQLHHFQTTLLNKETEIVAATGRATRLSETNADLRTERSKLREDINSLRETLNGSGDATAQRFGELQAKAAKTDALEKRLSASQSELEFARRNYQEASGAAKEHAETAAELTQEVEDLKRQASVQTVKLREKFTDDTSRALKDQVQKLEAENGHLQRALQKSQEENRRLRLRREEDDRRAGMSISTRSSSLPLQEPGPAALAAAKVLHGAQPSRHLTVGTARSAIRATVSANTSRSASPATGQPPRGTFKTSPLQRTVRLNDRD